MSLAVHEIQSLLTQLNDALLLEGADPVHWVICGGTALALHGLAVRTTRDVDVLGDWRSDRLELAVIHDFPGSVKRAIERVAAVHPELQGPGPSWVNLGPRQLVEFGLPAGFAERLRGVRVGECLTLHLLGRSDLIALKLFAASDDLGRRQRIHLDDLRSLQPTAEEVESSIRWIERLPDPQHRIRSELKSIVQLLGHEDLAHYIIL